jgi:hypothetical protein
VESIKPSLTTVRLEPDRAEVLEQRAPGTSGTLWEASPEGKTQHTGFTQVSDVLTISGTTLAHSRNHI